MGLTRITSDGITDATIATADLADQSVTLAKLPHGTSSNDGKFLRANNGADPTFETVNTDLVSDTSPQLGGNLDVNTKNIVFGDSAGTTDDRLTFGAGDDLKIYSDGTNGILEGGGSGGNAPLFLNANTIRLQTQTGGEKYIDCQENGAVELYHNNNKKFETTSAGATVTGDFTVTDDITVNDDLFMLDDGIIKMGAGEDLKLFHESSSSDSFVIHQNENGHLRICSGVNGNGGIKLMNRVNNESYIECDSDAGVEIYHNNSKKLNTKSTGIHITGNVHAAPSGTTFATDNDTYIFQAAAPSQAYVSTYAANDGTSLFNHGFHFGIDTTSANLIVRQSKPINFYTNDSHRLQLTSDGHLVPAATNTFDLGTTAKRWRNIYTNDLNLSNEGGSNDVDGTWGSYTIQEGEESLFLINKRNGKKYKFNLTEVS